MIILLTNGVCFGITAMFESINEILNDLNIPNQLHFVIYKINHLLSEINKTNEKDVIVLHTACLFVQKKLTQQIHMVNQIMNLRKIFFINTC